MLYTDDMGEAICSKSRFLPRFKPYARLLSRAAFSFLFIVGRIA